MRRRRQRLPPLDYLIAFEAAARLGGFTAAAERLNLSQAAISRQIKLLERRLGVRLFYRGNRSVQLTSAGRTFLHHVGPRLDNVEKGVQDLKKEAGRPGVS